MSTDTKPETQDLIAEAVARRRPDLGSFSRAVSAGYVRSVLGELRDAPDSVLDAGCTAITADPNEDVSDRFAKVYRQWLAESWAAMIDKLCEGR